MDDAMFNDFKPERATPEMKIVPVTPDKFAIVDIQDYDRVTDYTWHLSAPTTLNTYYAQTGITENGKQKTVRMHCFIMGQTGIDHRDANGLNNTRANLRFATVSQNIGNARKQQRVTASQFKGVHKQSGKWKAQIYNNGKNQFLGLYTNEVDAAHAYDVAALEKWGDFARLNFPDAYQLTHLPLLVQMAKQCQDDSEQWFGLGDNLTHHFLGVAGELGECIELWKKYDRGSCTLDSITSALGEELTDVFIYILNVAGILGIDLEQQYKTKRAINVERFGKKDE